MMTWQKRIEKKVENKWNSWISILFLSKMHIFNTYTQYKHTC